MQVITKYIILVLRGDVLNWDDGSWQLASPRNMSFQVELGKSFIDKIYLMQFMVNVRINYP